MTRLWRICVLVAVLWGSYNLAVVAMPDIDRPGFWSTQIGPLQIILHWKGISAQAQINKGSLKYEDREICGGYKDIQMTYLCRRVEALSSHVSRLDSALYGHFEAVAQGRVKEIRGRQQ